MEATNQKTRETPEERKANRVKAQGVFDTLIALDLPTKDFVRLLRKSLMSLVADEEGAA